MSDEVLYVSPEDIASGRALPPDMARDLHAVASAESAAISNFSEALVRETGVLTENKLVEIAKQFFEDAAAESIANTIRAVEPEHKNSMLAVVAHWRKCQIQNLQHYKKI